MTVAEVRDYLENYDANWQHRPAAVLFEALEKLRIEFATDDSQLNILWALEEVARVQDLYTSGFALAKDGKFFEAWDTLEKSEVAAHSVSAHLQPQESAHFRLTWIQQAVSQLQQLFPYKLFVSPEIVIEQAECSICGSPIRLRSACGHEVGQVYRGKQCLRVITKADFLGIALVTEPGHKYSVLRGDGYDYSALNVVLGLLPDPITQWYPEWGQRRHPHHLFENCERDGPCPCGSSESYQDCCLTTEGVLRPHLGIALECEPPDSSRGVRYVGYGKKPVS